MRDSNPRGVAPKRFSRPPRYDRFGNPPDDFAMISIIRTVVYLATLHGNTRKYLVVTIPQKAHEIKTFSLLG